MAIKRIELEKLLIVKPRIEKIVKISSDGKNLLVRIPKEVRENLGLIKGDKLKFSVSNSKLFLEIIKSYGNGEKNKS